jgi:hypothetical protein
MDDGGTNERDTISGLVNNLGILGSLVTTHRRYFLPKARLFGGSTIRSVTFTDPILAFPQPIDVVSRWFTLFERRGSGIGRAH